MLIAKVLVKTIALSLVVFAFLGFLAFFLFEAGMSEGLILFAEGIAFTIYGYVLSKEWGSQASWAWGLLGFIAGALSFPLMQFCYEHFLAKGEQALEEEQALEPAVVPVTVVDAAVARVPVPSGAENDWRSRSNGQ